MAMEVYLKITRESVLLKIPEGMEVEFACEANPNYYVVVLSQEIPWEPEKFFVFAGHGEELDELPVKSKTFNKLIGRMILHAGHLQISFVPQFARLKLKILDRAVVLPTINLEQPRFFKYEVIHC